MQFYHLDHKGVGQLLKQARLFLGLTVKEVSGLSGVARSHIWNLENGVKEMSLEKFFKMCSALSLAGGDVIADNTIFDRGAFERVCAGRMATLSPSSVKGDALAFEVTVHYQAACCIVLARLLLMPGENRIPSGDFDFPTEELSRIFSDIELSIATDFSLKRRQRCLAKLQNDPVSVLDDFGLCDSEVFADYLAKVGEKMATSVKAGVRLPVPVPAWSGRAKRLFDYFTEGEDVDKLSRAASGHAASLLQEAAIGVVMMKVGVLQAGGKKMGVDKHSAALNDSAMKAHLPALRERLKALTQKRGAKSALAKKFGVSLASVSQWLSGKQTPDGETTLQLLEWVKQRER